MERLRCGVIFTDSFLAYLRDESQKTPDDSVLVINYVHCADGPREGESWWSLVREPVDRFEPRDLFEASGVRVALSRQTQMALKWKYVDYKDGQVKVA